MYLLDMDTDDFFNQLDSIQLKNVLSTGPKLVFGEDFSRIL